jgi:hypothetical protein
MGVKDANDAAFAAIIAHIPREDWLEWGLGNPAAMDTVKGRQRHAGLGALKSWC